MPFCYCRSSPGAFLSPPQSCSLCISQSLPAEQTRAMTRAPLPPSLLLPYPFLSPFMAFCFLCSSLRLAQSGVLTALRNLERGDRQQLVASLLSSSHWTLLAHWQFPLCLLQLPAGHRHRCPGQPPEGRGDLPLPPLRF